jgi:hypothetical protein
MPATVRTVVRISTDWARKWGIAGSSLNDREQGTGNREQGIGNREQGIGNREQGIARCPILF